MRARYMNVCTDCFQATSKNKGVMFCTVLYDLRWATVFQALIL